MKLFRKIRKNLLISGKTKSYLIYAFGEIFLIVVGILIAWKINDLNEINKNRIVEVKIYQSLNDELNSNLSLLDSSIFRYAENIQTIQNTINSIRSQPQKLTEEIKDGIIRVNYTPTKLHSGSMSSINSTNKFEFIESDSLRDLIAAYPNELDNFEIQEAKINNLIVNRLQPELETHISLLDILLIRDKKNTEVKFVSDESDYMELLNSRRFQNILVDRLLQTENQLIISNSLREKTQMIAFKLNKELDN